MTTMTEAQVRALAAQAALHLADALREFSEDTHNRDAMNAIAIWHKDFVALLAHLPYDSYIWLREVIGGTEPRTS